MSESQGRFRVGVDIGGTFTDIVARGGERTLARKVLTTHDDPARGVEASVAGIIRRGP